MNVEGRNEHIRNLKLLLENLRLSRCEAAASLATRDHKRSIPIADFERLTQIQAIIEAVERMRSDEEIQDPPTASVSTYR